MGEVPAQVMERGWPASSECRATPVATRPPQGAGRCANLRATLLSRSHRCNLNLSQEDKPKMTSGTFMARTRAALAIAVLAFATVSTTGCASQQELLAMPGLADMSATGPKGKKCYDKCAHAEFSCKGICPKSLGLCQEDCELDSKFCLRDCPELKNHNPDKIRLAD